MIKVVTFLYYIAFILIHNATKQLEIMEAYIQEIIKTGLANGATIEQMMSNPELAAKAYLESQLKSIDKIGKELSR
jgi:hypothetical protein